MHFNIDADKGVSISGWLAPDNPSMTPRLIVSAPGLPEIEVDAVDSRPDIQTLGVHPTGLCGFSLNNKSVPGLEQLKELEIIEASMRVPLYARFVADAHVPEKFFLFDCSLAPQRRMLDDAQSWFALKYSNLEQFGLETTLSLISNHIAKSLFASGRPLLFRYDHFLKERNYVRAALLREPFEELAERLLFLRLVAQEGADSPLMTCCAGVTNLIEFAAQLPLNDDRALTLAFRHASEAQRIELASPMTKVYGCDLDEPPRRTSVSRALDNLASLNVVGTRERFDLFKDLVANAVRRDIFGDSQPLTFQTVGNLAARLARIGAVADLLAEDLALYSYVSEAIAEGLENVAAN